MPAISFTLGMSQRPPQRQASGIYIRSSFRDEQLPAGLRADRFGGATTAGTGCTKKSLRNDWLQER
jgi:hypothetical protein